MNKEELEKHIREAVGRRYYSYYENEPINRLFTDEDSRLLELYDKVKSLRATGRSTRLVNEIIDNFFTQPMGTEILINDHYFRINDESGHYRANEILSRKVVKRLRNESPQIEFDYSFRKGHGYIIRKTPTAREMLLAEYEKELTRKLIEVNKDENSSNK